MQARNAYSNNVITKSSPLPPKILVCGTPRLWREMLGHVLQARLGTHAVGELEIEPSPASSPPGKSEWLIWCLGSGEEVENVLAHMSFAAKQPNVLLITSDGSVI